LAVCFCKVLNLNDLRQISVIGLGLLGGSLSLAVSRCFPGVKRVGYAHRASTKAKASELAVADEIFDDLKKSVAGSDMVFLATPIFTFEEMFVGIAGALEPGCIVTDVGSTKAMVHRWAKKRLPKGVHYVGSHPIAGSEQRGVEFSRDDLFEGAICIVTTDRGTDAGAVETVKEFWSRLGCFVQMMKPAEHDRIFGHVSHVPHATAVALVNASDFEELKFAGRGFIDTSRIASGPANIWSDILLSNARNVARGIDGVIRELSKLKKAIEAGDEDGVRKLLDAARSKRNVLIEYKIRKKEIIP